MISVKPFLRGLLLSYVALLTACSYSADFVVINASEAPVEIRYKVTRSTAGALAVSGPPAIIEASQLDTHGGQQWRILDSTEYQLIQDGDAEIVMIKLVPNHALRVTRLRDYGGHADSQPNIFAIQEIDIESAHSRINLAGKDKVRTSFSEVSPALYTLTYK